MYNRGINSPQEQERWLAAGWESVYDWDDFGDMLMVKAVNLVQGVIERKEKIVIVVDSD